MQRYDTTYEIAQAWGVSVPRAWTMLREAGIKPLGTESRPDGLGAVNIYRSSDVSKAARRYVTPGRERARRAIILRGIERRRAKREAQ